MHPVDNSPPSLSMSQVQFTLRSVADWSTRLYKEECMRFLSALDILPRSKVFRVNVCS